MYKLTYKGKFVDGFDTDQVVGNLAQLLNLKPKAVRLAFLSERPSVIKMLDSPEDVERWCAAFKEAGVYLDVIGMDTPDSANIADQIELELELHEMDVGDEEPDERRYLIRKTPATDVEEAEPQTFANQPLATRSLAEYPHTPTDNAIKDKPKTNGKAVNGSHAKHTNGHHGHNGSANTNGKVNGKTNGNHSIAAAENPIEIGAKKASKPVVPAKKAELQKTAGAPAQTVEKIEASAALEPEIHELSVAKIDALAAKALLEESVVENEQQIEPATVVAQESVTPSSKKAAPARPAPQDKSTLQKNAASKPAKKAVDKKVELQKAEALAVKIATGEKTAQSKTSDAVIDKTLEVRKQPDVPEDTTLRREQDVEPDVFEDLYEETDEEWRKRELFEQELLEEQLLEDRLAEELEEELHEDVNFHKSHFVWGMLIILLAILATAGTILWLKRSSWAPVAVAPQEIKITEAIASANLFGLVHADIDRLQMLSAKAAGMFTQLPGPKPLFWESLAQSGIDIKQQVDDVWLGAYGQNGQTKTLWVLQGNFQAEAWREWLKKNYIIDGDSPEGLIFSSIDENSCEKSPVLSASISNNQIAFGAPELVAAFNGRLQAGAAAEKNLDAWAKNYNAQMVSAVLFHPGQLPEGSAAMALGKLSLPAEPIQGIYLGLEPKTFPPALEFNAIIASNNSQFIGDATQKLIAAASVAKTTVATDWPETLAFYERIKISQDTNQVRATLRLDENAPQDIQLWFSSLLSRAFGVEQGSPVATEERIEQVPASFISLPSAELPAFASVKHFNEAFIAQTSSGPFGIGVRNVEQTEQGVEINMDVNAFNLPNLGKENNSVALRITDVVDHQDKSLLAEASGGCSNGMKQPTPINLVYQGNAMENGQMVGFTGLQGAKKITLPAGMPLTNVGAVKGVITHQLPVDVERITINGPLAGKTVDSQGVQLRFMSAGPGRLYFQMSGNTAALLQVNALNEDGKVLAVNNAVRGDTAFGSGKTVVIDYHGSVAAAEVIVASKMEQKNYEFSIARLFPPAKPFLQEKAEPAHLAISHLSALEKDSPPNDVVYPYQTPKQTIAAGPALIALNELNLTGQHFSLNADVYTRNNHPLVGQLSAVRMVISEIEDSSGNLHSVNHQIPIAMEHMGGSWVDGKFEADPNRPWLRGQLEMRERPLEQGDAVALWGKLVFLATEDPVSIKVPFQFGMQWNSNEGILKLRRWEAGRLIFDVEGNFPELMAVKALDDMGLVVSQPAVLRTSFGKSTIELDVKQIPETIEFNIARTQNPKEFPLEIRVLQ
ncbi:MAG TPA: hypothetical protein VL995_03565 [Cellvibrio sp.]|nr:hypothetical protein [Cellvibrio sp.]